MSLKAVLCIFVGISFFFTPFSLQIQMCSEVSSRLAPAFTAKLDFRNSENQWMAPVHPIGLCRLLGVLPPRSDCLLLGFSCDRPCPMARGIWVYSLMELCSSMLGIPGVLDPQSVGGAGFSPCSRPLDLLAQPWLCWCFGPDNSVVGLPCLCIMEAGIPGLCLVGAGSSMFFSQLGQLTMSPDIVGHSREQNCPPVENHWFRSVGPQMSESRWVLTVAFSLNSSVCLKICSLVISYG